MPSPIPTLDLKYVWEDSGCCVLGRLTGFDGELIKQADLTSISCKIFDADANRLETADLTPAVADTVYDAAQTSAAWPYDDGYNFRHLLPATAFPTGGHKYRVEYLVDPASADEENFHCVLEVYARNLYRS